MKRKYPLHGGSVRKQCWAGELRHIGRGRGMEEAFVGEGLSRRKSFYVTGLPLSVNGSEERMVSV